MIELESGTLMNTIRLEEGAKVWHLVRKSFHRKFSIYQILQLFVYLMGIVAQKLAGFFLSRNMALNNSVSNFILGVICVSIVVVPCISCATIYDTGAQNPSLVVFGFLLNHLLHCICFKMLFTVTKYLVSNRSYTCLIRAIQKMKISNKSFRCFVSS